METGWVKIKIYTNPIGAEIVRQMLEENSIPAVLMNKQDSSYHFGKLELYVQDQNKDMALELIENNNEVGSEENNAN